MAEGAEAILGFRVEDQQLQFLVKFSNGRSEWTSYKPIQRSPVFLKFIRERNSSLQWEVKQLDQYFYSELGSIIDNALKKPKKDMKLLLRNFDPIEYRLNILFSVILQHDQEFRKKVGRQFLQNIFYTVIRDQQKLHSDFLTRAAAKGEANISIENEIDYHDPPKFEYVTENLRLGVTPNEYLPLPEENGCKCVACTPSLCHCSKKGAYRIDKEGKIVLKTDFNNHIFECGVSCKCQAETCINRVTQKPRRETICLFKTKDRGWGLRAEESIAKGSYIMEFCGELLTQEEVESRSDQSFMYDLPPDASALYKSIDAIKYGNISRFLNHSCEPNVKAFLVNDFAQDPDRAKLCFFATKTIKEGVELTIDYEEGSKGKSKEVSEFSFPCSCGSKKCRKSVF